MPSFDASKLVFPKCTISNQFPKPIQISIDYLILFNLFLIIISLTDAALLKITPFAFLCKCY